MYNIYMLYIYVCVCVCCICSCIYIYVCAVYIAIGEENGNPVQYSCLENPIDRGAWWATVQRVTKSQARLSD